MADKTPSRRRRRLRIGLAAILVIICVGGILIWRQRAMGNFGVVVPGQVYRSAQPTADHVRDWSSRYGLKTIINLRGQDEGRDAEVSAAIASCGLKQTSVSCSAKRLPSSLWVEQMIAALESADRPMLIHCLDGADRTGVASVMAAMAIGGEPFDQASKQLSLKYGHIKGGPMKIGNFIQEYEKYCQSHGQPTGGWTEFRKWATEVYHPDYYFVQIECPESVSAQPGQTLPVELVVSNRSQETLPADKKLFTVACFEGSSQDDNPVREFGTRVELPRKAMNPGESAKVRFMLTAPQESGSWTVHFDVAEEGRTFFSRQGSPVPSCRLIVGGGATSSSSPATAGAKD